MTEKVSILPKRDISLDIARGIAILAVVFGHCGYRNIEIFVGLFHLPCFAFIAGVLYKGPEKIGSLDFFKKKFRRLYLPYVIYEVVFLLLRNVLFKLELNMVGQL